MHKEIKQIFFCVYILFQVNFINAQPTADSLFARYFREAQHFTNAYPREKAHLHFDNTSYYLGDTIWFKAYVTLAEKNIPSPVSKPLYVELLDQLGNVIERQIVQLNHGEGHGQIALNNTFFTGYYEVRAYTKWMLAFDEKQNFSRVFPVYRKRLVKSEASRDIATYRMDESMKQRPVDREKKFNMRFFPEGGQLVKGVMSVVAFELDGWEKDSLDIQGFVRSEKGETLVQLRALHNGMGYFQYKPEGKPATAEVHFEERTYKFKLPEALPEGYVLNVNNQQDALNVTVTRSSQQLSDTLALFAFSQGRPYTYTVIHFGGNLTRRIQIPAKELPEGVIQLSLITAEGVTMCDRFCYRRAHTDIRMDANLNKALYQPFERIDCRINVVDHQLQPIQTNCSVSIRDGVNSDYQEYDNTIYTDLLLASDLKGYIHQPGFYFADQSAGRRKMLDVLLLIRGWRKYDMSQLIGKRKFSPLYYPEKTLTLYGQVKSLLGKVQSNIDVSILARKDSVSIAGMTKTDSLGFFHVPVDGFMDSMDAFIQTRKQGKKMNKQATVSLFRNFEPALRKFDYLELNPVWKGPENLSRVLTELNSQYADSIMGPGSHLLEEVVVNAKRLHRLLNQTKHFEKEILGYYDITQIVNKMRDNGKSVYNFPLLLETMNQNFVSSVDNPQYLSYNNTALHFIVNGAYLSKGNTDFALDKDVDAIKSILLYYDQAGGESIYVLNKQSNRVVQLGMKNFWKDQSSDINSEDLFNANASLESMETLASRRNKDEVDENEAGLDEENQGVLNEDEIKEAGKKPAVICSITTIDDWDPEKTYKPRIGIRYTYIQGYNTPLEFYAPVYPNGAPTYTEDHRRTLYWNPNVMTDEKGELNIQCYNGGSSTSLTVSVEALYKGMPVALNMHSIKF